MRNHYLSHCDQCRVISCLLDSYKSHEMLFVHNGRLENPQNVADLHQVARKIPIAWSEEATWVS